MIMSTKKITPQQEFIEYKDELINRGINECRLALKQKTIENNLNKKLFFEGCRMGFRLCEDVICLEQIERHLITYSKKENDTLKKIVDSYKFENLFHKNISKTNQAKVKALSKTKGIRSSINHLYDSLNIFLLGQKVKN